MGSHPVNLTLRFLLELAALFAFGLWAWRANAGPLKWLLVIGLPVLAACAWTVLAVPEDPSRSGAAPVPIPGLMRLALEAVFFAAAVLCLRGVGWNAWGTGLAVVTILHYLASYDRLTWLAKR